MQIEQRVLREANDDITLLLVPVFYSIFVLDLKWIKWETTRNGQETTEAEPTTT
jgi:hypothetical protein